ncbi:GNAT family N-acetyltransferase [Sphingomonas oligophenolica]|uniref:GNAT family N-acetyltransferase n=1 Tax=Sphingomonas oligophenolica TaxID=301154 RepID=A0ABU9XZE8_9SPHN
MTSRASQPRYAEPAPIAAEHRLDGFNSGKPPLDTWLRTRALDNEGRASRTYVVVAKSGPQAGAVVAYYSLATGGVALSEIRGKYRHNLPNPVPVMVLGRLAVDRRHAGVGLGTALLRQALQRTLDIAQSVGVRMLMVHAIDDDAVAFYLRFGFHLFPAGSRTLYLPVEEIAGSLG